MLAAGASAATVGNLQGRPALGHPLEVNIPFTVDEPTARACAVANVRYGDAVTPRSTLHVQGRGMKRNLLVVSQATLRERTVTVNVRVGCGAKAVTRRFTLQAGMPAPVVKNAMLLSSAPPFPPAPAEAAPSAPAASQEELRKARAEADAAIAQLEATRKELAALLDVERRTSQTLINADHQVRDAKAEAARLHLVLNWVGAGLALVAAAIGSFEFHGLWLRRRTSRAGPVQQSTILSGAEMPT
jgi:hypothetical protein